MRKKKKRVVPRWKKLLIAAIAAATLGGGALAAGNLPYFKGEKVIEVVDGDTFIIENKQPIRLYGVNAPDIHYCFGKEAQQALSSLILGKLVQLREPEVDRFGRRVMSLVYINGVLVNEVMIRAGFAEYENEGGSQGARMNSANMYARTNHIGIFSPQCYQTEPTNPSCVIKGNNDTNKRNKMYFLPQCRGYSRVLILKYQGDDWFCTESEAKRAGFVKSDTCK